MRYPLILLSSILILAAGQSSAAAEEQAPDVPIWSAEEMAFDVESLPEGWAACPKDAEIPEGAPTEAMLMDLGQAVGLDEDTLFVETRTVKKGETQVVASLIDIDTDPAAFRAVIDKSAAAGGWMVKELGSPMRPMVVWSADAAAAKELAAFAREAAVYRLAENAWANLGERSIDGHRAGMERLRAAGLIEEKAGVVAAIAGFLQFQQDRGRAIGAWMHALKKDTPIPPKGEMRVQVAHQLGQVLLEANRDELLAPALEVLKDAVANEAALDVAKNPRHAWMVYGNRYNLACTYSRMGKLDDAFKTLEESLVFAKEHLDAEAFAQSYNHCRNVDPDMAPLREDERFAKLLDRFDPEGTDDE
jgi:tetratricopeptide (TPR) repeat protein